MHNARLWVGITSVLVLLVYVSLSMWWVRSGDVWYRSLDRPSWQPPDVVFGLAWTYNFIALFVAAVQVTRHGSGWQMAVWTVSLVIGVVMALGWAWLFYVQHAVWVSSAALVLAVPATVPLVFAAWGARPWVGALLLPYLLWLCIAAGLAIGYALRNG